MTVSSAQILAYAKSARREFILGLHMPKGERFYHFCAESRLVPDIEEQPGREMCAEFESTIPEWGSDIQKRKLYLAPRNTFKTSIAMAFAIYLLLLFPNIRILLIRSTHVDAITILTAIRQALSTNAVILEVWWDFSQTALVWTDERITVGERDNREMALKEPTIDTAGIGVSKTGYHPDYVFIDDPVNEQNYRSAKAREDGRITIQALSPVLETYGSMMVTGTFWAENDLYNWILAEDDRRAKDAARDGESEPETARLWTTYIRSAYDLGRGEAGFYPDGTHRELFFPTRLNWAYLKRQKAGVDIKLYTSWFENRTSADSVKMFRPEYMIYFEAKYFAHPLPTLEFETGLIIPLYTALLVDPALTANADSDSTGAVAVGWDARDDLGDYRWWFLEAREINKTPSGLTFDLVDMLRTYDPDILLIEAANADPEMISRITLAIADLELRTKIRSYSALQHEKPFELHERRGRIGKGQRIEGLEPIFRESRALLRRGRCAPLAEQLLRYPSPGDRDDVMDAAAMGRLVARPCEAKTIVEAQDRVEELEERLSWGPGGPPKAQPGRPPPNGAHVSFYHRR